MNQVLNEMMKQNGKYEEESKMKKKSIELLEEEIKRLQENHRADLIKIE